jgi:phospholipid/cholesterol/gamma-HCH transport system substrate-binding protein
MEQEDKNKIKLGVFVVMAVALFAVGIFLIGDKQNMFGSRFTITAVFNDIAGLKIGNNVRFAGITAGTVKDIEMLNDTTIRVYMLIRENEGKHIRKNAIASIGTDGLLGDKLVNIKPGRGISQTVNAGDELVTYRAVETEMMMETLQKTNENIAVISETLVAITGKLNEGSGTLGMLLKDETLASNLSAAAKNINAVSKQANRFTIELNDMVNKMNSDQSAMGALIADTTLGASIEETINNLKDASAQTTDFAKKLDELVQNINTGEGAAGTVINDTAFSADMEETMRNLKEGTENFNQNMEALKSNFLFRRYFKKKEKEKTDQ